VVQTHAVQHTNASATTKLEKEKQIVTSFQYQFAMLDPYQFKTTSVNVCQTTAVSATPPETHAQLHQLAEILNMSLNKKRALVMTPAAQPTLANATNARKTPLSAMNANKN